MSNVKESMRQAVIEYFANSHGKEIGNLYEQFMNEAESPLLETILQQARQNQSQAARWLGLSRNTVRKLLHKHNLIKEKEETLID